MLRTLSAHNPRVVRLAKLSARRRLRASEGCFVVDGPTLVGEALAAGVHITEVFVDVDRLDEHLVAVVDRAEAAGAEVFGLGSDVLGRVTDPVHPQPIAAVASRSESGHTTPSARLADATSVLVLAGVGDPGNAGTLVRSAVACGFDAVAVTPGTVEVFGPKALRASAGALFHVEVIEFDGADDVIGACHDAGLETVATTLEATTPYDEVDLSGRCAVLIGNEAHGLAPALAAAADVRVRIPMVGPVESLNAAMAGTIVCFEALRQRRRAAGGASTGVARNEAGGPLDSLRGGGSDRASRLVPDVGPTLAPDMVRERSR